MTTDLAASPAVVPMTAWRAAPAPISPSLSVDAGAGPPRLPQRARARTVGKSDDPQTAAPPPLPTRIASVHMSPSSPQSPAPSLLPALHPSSPQRNRDGLEGYQPPPPPVRSTLTATVVSPPRREPTRNTDFSSDEDEGEEPHPTSGISSAAKRMLEEFPDSTYANRRPPAFVPDVRMTSMHHVYCCAVFGRHVCTGAHHVRVYDTQMSDRPIYTVELKDTGLDFRIKESRITAMCFRPAGNVADEGRYLWCGTKDGHLWELDIRAGAVTDTRPSAHSSAVIGIFRYKHWLLTLEEAGKLLVFEAGKAAEVDGMQGSRATPDPGRTLRISEKFTFAKMVVGRLWISSGPANRSTTSASSRGPTIRVYEPCSPDSQGAGRTLFTSEWTGAVTSATVMPLKPGEVYLGHEGGFVSVWSAEDLSCLRVLKISTSDILALEGVGERLWAGNRKGQIYVYDIGEKPWQTTNVWTAHP